MELANGATGCGRAGRSRLQARYQHQPGSFGNGQLRFQVDSNAMPLDQFQMVSKDVSRHPRDGRSAWQRRGGHSAGKAGPARFRLVELERHAHGRGLRINDQPVRDVTLTATTKGSDCRRTSIPSWPAPSSRATASGG